MDEFYTVLSKYYDAIFKSNPAKLDFLTEGLSTVRGDAVLDVGAATGTFSLPLASRGYQVTAVDYDRQMVTRMSEKAEILGILERHESLIGDMREIRNVSNKGPFRLIYCIGNTLVHLEDENEVLVFLKDAMTMLDSGGRLVLQIVNYNRIVKELESEGTFIFPAMTVEGNNLFFRRCYKKHDLPNKVIFETHFDEGDESGQLMGSTVLLALQSESLKKLLEEAGYTSVALYGDFDKKEFISNQSPALVIEAFK